MREHTKQSYSRMQKLLFLPSADEFVLCARNYIFFKFRHYKVKVKVLQNAKKLKKANISINESFPPETLAYRK